MAKRASTTSNGESTTKKVKYEEKSDEEYNLQCRVLDVAVQAARTAGKLMKKHVGITKIEKTKFNAADLATKIDMECEEIVKSTALRHFPEHHILGEESVPPGTAAAEAAIKEHIKHEWLWVVDPIDGTTNFVHGIPGSVVSIGVAHKGEVVVAVIYDPYREEMFTAIKGHGTYLNDQKINVDSAKDLQSSLIAMGAYRPNPKPCYAAMEDFYLNSRGVRNLGACALHLCWVAAGRLSGYAQLGLCPWDLAAGTLLVVEAGGRVSTPDGKDYKLTDLHICATNGNIHQSVLDVLKKHKAHTP